jgi:hypothetical protein
MVQSAGWLCSFYRAEERVPLGTIVFTWPKSLSPPLPPCRVTGRANSEGRYPVQPLKQEKVPPYSWHVCALFAACCLYIACSLCLTISAYFQGGGSWKNVLDSERKAFSSRCINQHIRHGEEEVHELIRNLLCAHKQSRAAPR